MTTGSRLAVAPAVAFALAFAVVLALGQLMVRVPQPPLPAGIPSASPSTPPAGSGATSTTPPPSSLVTLPTVATFGPANPGTTFASGELAATVELFDDEDVRVWVTVPPGTAVAGRNWTLSSNGRWCAFVNSGSTVHIRLERTS